MNFRQRLLRFMIGVAIGLALVFIFFGPRGCGQWLPGNQVKKWIRENNANIEISPNTSCRMQCMDLSVDDVLYTISEEGKSDVLFSESQTKGYPKTYLIESSKEDSIQFRFGFTLREDSSSVVSSVERLDRTFNCDCD